MKSITEKIRRNLGWGQRQKHRGILMLQGQVKKGTSGGEVGKSYNVVSGLSRAWANQIWSRRSHHRSLGSGLAPVSTTFTGWLNHHYWDKDDLSPLFICIIGVGRSKILMIGKEEIVGENQEICFWSWFCPETLLFWFWISSNLSQTGAYLKNKRLELDCL